MSKPRTIKGDDVKKIPKGAIPLTPRNVRQQIIRLEIIQQRIQMAIPKEMNILKKNQLIDLMERTEAQIRQLYFLLHELKEKGDVQKEIEEKLVVDWEEKKCPKCEKAKLNDEGNCTNPECELWVEIKKAKEDEHDITMMDTETKIKEMNEDAEAEQIFQEEQAMNAMIAQHEEEEDK